MCSVFLGAFAKLRKSTMSFVKYVRSSAWKSLAVGILVGVRFPALVQTGPEARPASSTMGTLSFPGVKRPGRGFDQPPHPAPRLKKE